MKRHLLWLAIVVAALACAWLVVFGAATPCAAMRREAKRVVTGDAARALDAHEFSTVECVALSIQLKVRGKDAVTVVSHQ